MNKNLLASSSANTTTSTIFERIVFLESTVKDQQHLMAGIRPDTEVVCLDGQRDGIEQIAEVLASRTDVKSVHIVAHGEPGRVRLGSTQLRSGTLERYIHQFHRWRTALAADGEVLLYGCRVAAGTIGQRFVRQLGQILDAKIAASTTLIGNAALGGNWDLDVRSAPGEFALAFESATLASYGGVLVEANPLYASEGAGSTNLRVVNINDATSEVVGQTAFRTFAIARQNPTENDGGLVYYIGIEEDGAARVGAWDPALGQVGTTEGNTVLGGQVGATGQFLKMGQARDDTLFAMTGDDNILYTINIQEGDIDQRATEFARLTGGSKPFPVDGGSGDIVFDPVNPERLFITVTQNAGSNTTAFYDLYTFDTNTRQTTFLGAVQNPDGTPLSPSGAGALGFGEDGGLYTTSQRQLFRVRFDDADNGRIPTDLAGATGVPFSDLGSLPSETPQVDLTVDKRIDPTPDFQPDPGLTDTQRRVQVGDTIEYEITLENNSVAPAGSNRLNLTGIEITDPIPAGLDVDITNIRSQITRGTGNITTQTLTDGNYRALVDLNEQSTIVVFIQGTVTAEATQILSNTVTVKPPQGFNLVNPDTDLNLIVDPDPDRIDDTVTALLDNLAPTTQNVTDNLAAGDTKQLVGLIGQDADGTVVSYTISTLPPGSQGTLFLNGTAVTIGQVVSPVELAQLEFQATNGFTGTTFTYAATDNNGATDATPATVTLNPPPSAEDDTTEVAPGSDTTLPALMASDPNGTVVVYRITQLPPPEQGILLLNGVPVQPNQNVPPDLVDDLVFRAEPGFSGTTFQFTAIDNNGSPDPTPATVTLTPGNAPPDTNDSVERVEPGGTVTLMGLGGSDPAPGTVTGFIIDTLPPAEQGQLLLGGNPVAIGQELTPAQLGQLTFSATDEFTQTTFNYSSVDNQGATDPTPGTVFLAPPGANILPETDDSSTSASPGVPRNIPDLGGDDPDGNVDGFIINTLPEGGTLFLGDPANGGTAVTVNQDIPPDRISDLFFVGDAGFNGTTFTYSTRDNLQAVDPTPATVTIDALVAPPDTDSAATSVQDDPVNVVGLGGTPTAEISFFTILTLPPENQGQIFLGDPTAGGPPIEVGQVLTPEQIDTIFFQPGTGFSGTTFEYTATNTAGLTDPTPATVTITGTNLPPETEDSIGTLGSNTTLQITDLGGEDPDGSIAFFSISSLPDPDQGTLFLGDPADGGIAVVVGLRLSPDQLDGLFFQSSGSFSGTTFTYTATDNFGSSDPTPGTVTLSPQGGPIAPDTDTDTDADPTTPTPVTPIVDPEDNCPLPPTIGGFFVPTPGELPGAIVFPPVNIPQPGLPDTGMGAGTGGDDNIQGRQSDDMIRGDEGADTLDGGEGNDSVEGGNDSDEIFGDEGNDVLEGDLGDDIILGSLGSVDPVGSEEERDSLFGNQGADLLKGGQGEDLLRAGQDDDLGFGGKDNDDVFGDLGSDTLGGDLGNDTVTGGNGDPNNPDRNGEDVLYGGPGDDVVFGNQANDLLVGEDGDDVIHGGRENDSIFGDSGNDTLMGEIGNDTILGSRGSAVDSSGDRDFISGNAGEDVIKGGEGEDFIVAGKGADLVYGGKNDDVIYGDQDGDVLVGDLGNDTLIGGNGIITDPDVNGNDLLFGLEGNDVMEGNQGNDSIVGGNGDDFGRGGQDDDILWGEAGNDRLLGDLGNDTVCGGFGNDTIIGGNGIPGSAADGNDKLCGGGGDDLIFGNSGDDTVEGASGNDALYGGQGNDTITGGSGNDLLFGDLGNDLLIGGAGNDVFVLAAGNGIDTMTDFQVGIDLLALSGGLTFEALTITQVESTTIISSGEEQLVFLSGNLALDATNFQVI